jgi:hypothetical protein
MAISTTHTSSAVDATPPVGVGSRRLGALSGSAFVLCVLAGNSLTETVAVPEGDAGAEALATLVAKDGDRLVAAGTILELLGFVLLAVFTAYVIDLLRRRAALAAAGVLAGVSAVLMLAVKLSSAAPYLAGVTNHESLSPDAALSLVATNGAAFVVGWLPWAVFVGAAAVSLHGAGVLGRGGQVTGLAVGVLGLVAALLGVAAPDSANPVPFLLGLLWTAVVGVTLAVREPTLPAGGGKC